MYGELLPLGGGDPIPLLKTDPHRRAAGERRHRAAVPQRVGQPLRTGARRRLLDGEGPAEQQRHQGQRHAGDRAAARSRATRSAIAKHDYEIAYEPARLGAVAADRGDSRCTENIFGRSLLESAGLENRRSGAPVRNRPSRAAPPPDRRSPHGQTPQACASSFARIDRRAAASGDLTRSLGGDPDAAADQPSSERISGKGELTRKRTGRRL